jgi:uncharacterized protein
MLTPKVARLDADDFRSRPISICGQSFVADHSGALYWPGEDALIVSDLLLGASSQTAARDTLARLARALDETGASTVIALGGDHMQGGDAGGLNDANLSNLRILQEDRDWIWVGEFDDPAVIKMVGGHRVDHVAAAGLTLRHRPIRAQVTHEISGEMRPVARLSRHGHTILRPCFVGGAVGRVQRPRRRIRSAVWNAWPPGLDARSGWRFSGGYPVAARGLMWGLYRQREISPYSPRSLTAENLMSGFVSMVWRSFHSLSAR